MIETKRTKSKKPRKNNVVVDFIKAVSEKSAKQFEQDIISGKLYDDLKPKKKNEKK